MKKFFHAVVAGLPESVNRVWRNRPGSSRPFLSKKAKEWKGCAVSLMRSTWKNREPYEGRLALYVRLTRHNRVRYDLDNRMKLIQDSLQDAGIILNDCQIHIILAEKVIGDTDSTEVMLFALGEDESSILCRVSGME